MTYIVEHPFHVSPLELSSLLFFSFAVFVLIQLKIAAAIEMECYILDIFLTAESFRRFNAVQFFMCPWYI